MILALALALVVALLVMATIHLGSGVARGRTVYETPNHLYPSALVADGDAGDAPEFVLPEDLTSLSAEYDDDGALVGGELHDLEVQAVEAFDAIRATDLDPEAITTLATLADAVDVIRSESTRRATAAEEAAGAAAALADRVHPAGPADPEADPDPDADPEAVVDPAADPEAVTDPVADPVAEPEPVLASGRRGVVRVPLGRIRDRAPAPAHSDTPAGVTITAAADVPGVAGGAEVADTAALARLVHGRTRALGRADGASALVAAVTTEYEHTITDGDTKDTMREAMVAASSPEALVAAGGWCAPSDRLWDYFAIEATGGLLDLPTVGVTRGGLEWPVSPSIGDVFSTPWLWTEDDDIAALGNPHVDPDDDVTKPCFRIPCGTWDEARLRAHGVCITHGNLSNEAWPEQTRRYIDLVMAAHAHVMSGRNLARMVALSTPVSIAATAGAAAPLLSAIELEVMDYRDKFRMDDSVLLEGVFDAWVPGVIRADIARRGGISIEEVPTSRIVGWFQDRGVRPQFVHNFHPLQLGASPAGDGFRETWPTAITFLLYAAGTFVRGVGPSIDLGVVRDSTLNATNDHTAAWTEETDLVVKLGHESRLVTVPVVPNGVTSAMTFAGAGPLA